MFSVVRFYLSQTSDCGKMEKILCDFMQRITLFPFALKQIWPKEVFKSTLQKCYVKPFTHFLDMMYVVTEPVPLMKSMKKAGYVKTEVVTEYFLFK